MRTREEIENKYEHELKDCTTPEEVSAVSQAYMLAILLDIRELITKEKE